VAVIATYIDVLQQYFVDHVTKILRHHFLNSAAGMIDNTDEADSRQVTVHLIEGRNLIESKRREDLDLNKAESSAESKLLPSACYTCEVTIGSSTEKTDEDRGYGKQPHWDEMKHLDVSQASLLDDNTSVVFTVMIKTTDCAAAKFVGDAALPLGMIFAGQGGGDKVVSRTDADNYQCKGVPTPKSSQWQHQKAMSEEPIWLQLYDGFGAEDGEIRVAFTLNLDTQSFIGASPRRGQDASVSPPPPSGINRQKTEPKFRKVVSKLKHIAGAMAAGGGEFENTITGEYLLNWAQHGQRTAGDFDDYRRLERWLAHFVSDDSPTSIYSLQPTAAFWRQVEGAFPFAIDYLCTQSQEDVRKFREVMEKLLSFSNDTKQGRSQVYDRLISPTDQSSVVYWLANATDERRKVFADFLLDIVSCTPELQDSLKKGHTPRHCLQAVFMHRAEVVGAELRRQASSKFSFTPSFGDDESGTSHVDAQVATGDVEQASAHQEVIRVATHLGHGDDERGIELNEASPSLPPVTPAVVDDPWLAFMLPEGDDDDKPSFWSSLYNSLGEVVEKEKKRNTAQL
jgi:hypothetical protein